MIAISMPQSKCNWSTMSFTSTLYLCPILDILLANIPPKWQPEIRLGLQEALVNAAKHGNKLDPNKTVVVQFLITEEQYSWIISDEGNGFIPNCNQEIDWEALPPEDSECGRGLCILYNIFDQVYWNRQGTELRLCKQVKRNENKQPIVC